MKKTASKLTLIATMIAAAFVFAAPVSGQTAEEKAAKLAVKLLFPLVFCLFPAFYVIVLGPSMLSLFRHFVSMGG